MILFVQIIFWISILLIMHTYVLYPWILKVMSANKSPNSLIFEQNDELPEIAILMAVFNEEDVIANKILSVYESDYPEEKIHFYIGSDNSSDQTNEIVKSFQLKYPNLKLVEFFERTGKAAIVNSLEELAVQEFLILTDANVFFEKDTIYSLIKHFKNPKIAVVGGNILNLKYKNEGISFQEKKYLERENMIKYREGLIWGTMIGAFGGLYAIRKNCYTPIPRNFLMDDFYITMHTLKLGKKAINELSAISYEDVSNKISEEFRRKVRISAGNFQNLSVFKKLLWPMNTGLSFSFLSHKVLRWVTPFLLIIALLCNLYLFNTGYLYQLTLLGQVLFLLIPIFDALLKKIEINLKLFRFITHFYSMNLALLVGFIKFSTGVKTNIWRPTERNQ